MEKAFDELVRMSATFWKKRTVEPPELVVTSGAPTDEFTKVTPGGSVTLYPRL